MPLKGYTDYKRREFCKDMRCPVQIKLETEKKGSLRYEEIRRICKTGCKFTTYQFHHWLMEKGYLIVRLEDKE